MTDTLRAFADEVNDLGGAQPLRKADDRGVAGQNEELAWPTWRVFQAGGERERQSLLQRQGMEHRLKEPLDMAAGEDRHASVPGNRLGQIVEYLVADFFDDFTGER